MSTKTSIKRIAAVAAVALTLGGFSAVSAHAGIGSLWTIGLTSGSTTSTIGGTATAVIQSSFVADAAADLTTMGCQFYAVPAASSSNNSSLTLATGASSSNVFTNATYGGTYASASWNGYLPTSQIAASAGGRSTGYTSVSFSPDTAGTYDVRCFEEATTVSRSIYTDWILTVAAPTVNHSTAFISTSTGSSATADSSTLTGSATASSTPAARISVKQYSAADTTTVTSGYSQSVTVSTSGAGLVGTLADGSNRGPSSSVAAAGAYNSEFYLFPDGRTGTSTITVAVNGVTVSTKTFTFVGTAAKYVFDNVAADTIQAATYKTYIGVGDTGTLTITAADANGNAAAVGTIAAATSSNTAVATVAITTNVASATTAVLTVTGIAAGTANITIVDSTSATVKSLVIPVRVTGTTVAKVTLTFDSSSYAPGQKGTLTAAAFTAAGDPVADGTRDIWGTVPTFSTIVQGTAPTFVAAGEALAAGVVTYTFYAPVTNGTLTVSGTDSTSAANTVSATATVSSTTDAAAQAAVDAANEATDAANAATDAANNAMDSADAAQQAALDAGDKADAALAAVTDLATKVSAIATQIAALSALVKKIAAKVKA